VCAGPAGVLLGNLRESRKCADYELGDTGIETAAQAALELQRAREVERLLAICSKAANIPTLRAEMTDYRDRANVR
jgi:hypothetical protein